SDSVEGECVFEGDYAVPPLPVTEGMQHIRIMEGVSRSLPSSPLLSHQALNMRLQPLKRLPGNTACVCCVCVGENRLLFPISNTPAECQNSH
ncbi:hypothetical protein M9458_006733, partial [Cirrhinus mrigala]